MNSLLLTGATGFLGSAFARQFTSRYPETQFTALARDPVRANIQLRNPRIQFVHADITDPETLTGHFEGVHTVIHLASKILSDEVSGFHRVNVEGTENVLRVCRDAGVRRIIYVSNASVYGFEASNGSEEHEVTAVPETPISMSRHNAEQKLIEYQRKHGIQVLILRPLFVYGSGDRFFIPTLLRGVRKLPVLLNGGNAGISVISSDSLAGIIVSLSQRNWPMNDLPVYHASEDTPVSLRKLLNTVDAVLDLHLRLIPLPYRLALLLIRLRNLGNQIFFDSTSDTRMSKRNIQFGEIRHRLHLISFDHFYSNRRLKELVPETTLSDFESGFRQYADFYRSVVPQKRVIRVRIGEN